MNLKKTTAPWVQTAVTAALLIGAVSAAQAGVGSGVNLPKRSIYGMTSDQSIYVLKPGASNFVRLGRAEVSDGGNLIGIDFRPADATPNRMYGLTDKGNIYTINVGSNNFLGTQLVSAMGTRFTGGFGNIMDFNPVVNALRVTGTNDQNLAVVNGTGNLATTVAQTKFAYATGDVNFGQDPELIGGAYTNNFAGATTTLFFLIDHDKDTFVTIADKTATGSSNTGGGQLQTLGTVVDQFGAAMNFSPTTDLDIYTDANGINFLVGQSTRWMFSIDLNQINPNLALGKTQRIVAKRGNAAPLPGSGAPLTGGFFDIAIPTR